MPLQEEAVILEDTIDKKEEMSSVRMFGLLIWKNWLLQKRKVALTVFEFLTPILIALILLVSRQFTDIQVIDTPVTWDVFKVDSLSDDLVPPSGFTAQWKLAYTPKNDVTKAIMASVATKLDVISGESEGYEDESNMTDFLMLELDESLQTYGGIVFESDLENGLPEKITYKIRLKSTSPRDPSVIENWQTERHFGFDRFQLGPAYGNGYEKLGFLSIQKAVDEGIILQKSPTSSLSQIQVQMQRFPYPPYVEDNFIFILRTNLPQNVMFSFILMAINIVRDVVLEKEKKLKESMKLMGLSNWVHWLAWFTKYFIFMTVVSLVFTILFKLDLGNGAVVNTSDGSLLFFMFLFYIVATILFCFAISVFFSSANVGAAAGGIIFFLAYIPYYVINMNYKDMTLSYKLLACLLPNCCMALGFNLLSLGEGTGYGVHWEHLTKKIIQDEELTMGHIFLFFIINCIIAALITWYVDAIKPGEYGVPKPWNFFLKRWYWCGGDQEDTEMQTDHCANEGEFFEEGAPNAGCGVKIQGLRKEFQKDGATVVAVDHLNMDMYEGQITALLGHNGAGKTTTMFMITGFIPPTRGTVFVSGQNIRTNLAKVRQSLGLCPQHNVLFDLMTVSEHLEFFAKLKGCPKDQVKAEVNDMIAVLHLQAKKHALSKSLSGGMKRKLSVGIALIAGSKVVVLDEPTSGMDPEARRQTWDILQSQREGRTILLTTHFMDEADYLGDRIAIMAAGKLVCCGSSLFLKKKYGVGYHMVMVKQPECRVNEIHRLVSKHVPDAKLESDVSAELSFILPHESSAHFEELFSTLEKNKSELGISSFGASVTTMEEVFLKVGEGSNGDDNEEQVDGFQNRIFEDHPIVRDGDVELAVRNKCYSVADYLENTGLNLQLQQFGGMFMKRLLYALRSPVVTIVQLVLPILFTVFACLLLKINITDSPALKLSYSYFEAPIVPYMKNANGYTTVNNLADNMKGYLDGKASFVDISESSTNISDYIVEIGKENLNEYTNVYLVGAYFEGGFNDTTNTHLLKAFFNGESFHTSPLALNTVGNTLLRYFTGCEDCEIEVINHPVPIPASVSAETELVVARFRGVFVSIIITFGMTFLVATFVVFTVKERNVGAKHCQFVSGVAAPNFWFSAFAWDILNFMIPGVCIIIVIAAFDVDAYVQEGNLGKVFLVILMYGFSVLPFVYAFSFIFDVPSTGYTWICVLGIFSGLITLVLVAVFKAIDSLRSAGEIMEWIFYLLLPNFCFAHALEEINMNYISKNLCRKFVEDNRERTGNPDLTLEQLCNMRANVNLTSSCCPDSCDGCQGVTHHDNYFAMSSPGIGRAVLFMALQFCVFFGIIFFIESSLGKNFKRKILSSSLFTPQTTAVSVLERQTSIHQPPSEDSDVTEERQRILQTNLSDLASSDTLILRQLRKYYGSFLAVDRICLGVKTGECFGLLGVNGAGKTSTFKMLTGDETISGGSAYICGYKVTSEIKKVRENLGYCPQFDALIDKLTVQETLYMYARLRGVPESQIKRVTDNLISSLLLDDYKVKQAGTLSGGNKRKLSTAIALVGDSPIVFLDEPTTGMDPVARRHLWNTLTKVRENGRTLILTSHSMEECEALCTRLAIMVNGQFKCLGSSQHLKDKFGEGYTLTAKIAIGDTPTDTETRTQCFMEFVEQRFPGCVLKDHHHALVMYQIRSTENQSWAHVFGSMERARETYHIEDYSVSQTTLEQVFINFARAQIEPEQKQMGCMKRCKTFCL